VEAAKRDLKPIAKKRLGLAVAACHEAKKVAAKHSKAQSRGSVAQFLGKLKLDMHTEVIIEAGFDTVDR
jgi:hypothetical protein